jgi:hypothetical protein
MRGRSPGPSPHVYGGQAVYGLDVGVAHARRRRRLRHVWDRAVTTAAAIALAIGIVAGIWFGYQVYLEHTKDAEIQHQHGVDEQARRIAEQSMNDVIDDLGQSPVFNGPGAPVLGLGPATTEP